MRRLLVAMIVLVSCAGCGGSSSPTSPSPTPTPSTFSLSGRVTELAHGHSLAGATVTIVDGPNANKTTTTDSIGSYRFDALIKSGFTLRVTAKYYNAVSTGVTLTSDQPAFNVALLHAPMNIEYRVTGTSRDVDVFYDNGRGGTESKTVIPPWSYTFSLSESGYFLYLDATNDASSGDVTAAIYINGELFKTASASGKFGDATADGSTP